MKPKLDGLRTIKVRASAVGQAIDRAKETTSDWQAEIIEILLIPNVRIRWERINNRFYVIARHSGIPYHRFTREDNLARCESSTWSQIAGYTLSHPDCDIRWNSVRDDWYGHGASCCFDGIRRETFYSFAESLRDLYYHYSGQYCFDVSRLESNLRDYRIEFVNDLA